MLRLLVGFILGVSVALGVGAFAMDPNAWMNQLNQQQQLALQQQQAFEMMQQRQMLEDMQQRMKRGYPCR